MLPPHNNCLHQAASGEAARQAPAVDLSCAIRHDQPRGRVHSTCAIRHDIPIYIAKSATVGKRPCTCPQPLAIDESPLHLHLACLCVFIFFTSTISKQELGKLASPAYITDLGSKHVLCTAVPLLPKQLATLPSHCALASMCNYETHVGTLKLQRQPPQPEQTCKTSTGKLNCSSVT